MLDDVDKLLKHLNSAADWAVVGGFGIVGFVADAAADVVPLAAFTPGICGLIAAGTPLTVKRSGEAIGQRRAERRYLELLMEEAERVRALLAGAGRSEAAEALHFEIRAASIRRDGAALQKTLNNARRPL